jgi:hypothetical protein
MNMQNLSKQQIASLLTTALTTVLANQNVAAVNQPKSDTITLDLGSVTLTAAGESKGGHPKYNLQIPVKVMGIDSTAFVQVYQGMQPRLVKTPAAVITKAKNAARRSARR